MKSNKLALSLLVAVSMVAFTQCKGKPKNSMTGVFTLITGNVSVNEKPAKVGMRVGEKDTVFVEKDSSGILQFGDKALLTIRPNTKIKIASLVKTENGESKIHLAQYSGSTFNRVMKNKRVAYKIATPTTTAGVRGTSFSVSFDESKNSKIKLLDGKVAVKKIEPKKEGEEMIVNEEEAFTDFDEEAHSEANNEEGTPEEVVVLEAGEKVEVASNTKEPVKKKKMESVEKKQLETMKKIPMVSSEVLKKANEGGAELPQVKIDKKAGQIINNTEEKAEQIIKNEEKKAAQKPLTIEELREKYGRLSKVTTKSGKVYIGSFRQGSGSMTVITTHGSVTVATSDVAQVSPY